MASGSAPSSCGQPTVALSPAGKPSRKRNVAAIPDARASMGKRFKPAQSRHGSAGGWSERHFPAASEDSHKRRLHFVAEDQDQNASPPKKKSRQIVQAAEIGDVRTCMACSSTSNDVVWAATSGMTTNDGSQELLPVGNACKTCYVVGVDCLGYATFLDYCEAIQKGKLEETLIAQIKNNLQTPSSSVDFPTSKVDRNVVCEIGVVERCIGVKEKTLRNSLEVGRLTKASTKEIPTISIPLPSNPNEDTTLFLFEAPAPGNEVAESVSVEIRTKMEIKMGTCFLSHGQNTHAKHGWVKFSDKAEKDFSSNGVQDLCSKGLIPLPTFLAEYQKGTPKHGKQVPGLTVQGLAAKEYEVVPLDKLESKKEEDQMQVDLSDVCSGQIGENITPTLAGVDEETTLPEDDEDLESNRQVCDTWTHFYQEKLPLRDVLVGPKKGRTSKAMSERADELLSHPDTRGDGTMLKQYFEKVKIAEKWRGGKVLQSMDQKQLDHEVLALLDGGCIFPAETCQALLQRYLNQAKAEQKWVEFTSMSLPFRCDEKTFDAFDPKMQHLPRTVGWRLTCFNTIFFVEALCGRIFLEAKAMAELSAICNAALPLFEDVDLLTLERQEQVYIGEAILAIQGLKCYIEMPFDLMYEEGFVALDNAKSTVMLRKLRPLLIVANACKGVSLYKQRAKTWGEMRPIIIEKGDAMKQHLQQLETHTASDLGTMSGDAAIVFTDNLTTMCEDLSIIQEKAAPSHTQAFSNKIEQALSHFAEAMLKKSTVEADWMLTWWSHGEKMLQSASLAFPMSTSIPGWQEEAASIKQNLTKKVYFDDFNEVAVRLCEQELPWPSEALEDLDKKAMLCNVDDVAAPQLETIKKMMDVSGEYMASLAWEDYDGSHNRMHHVMAKVCGIFFQASTPESKFWSIIGQLIDIKTLDMQTNLNAADKLSFYKQVADFQHVVTAGELPGEDQMKAFTVLATKLPVLLSKFIEKRGNFQNQVLQAKETALTNKYMELKDMVGAARVSAQWSKTQRNDVGMPVLVEAAAADRLLQLNVESIETKVKELLTAKQELEQERSLAGVVTELPLLAEAMTASRVTNATKVEMLFLNMYQHSVAPGTGFDVETARATINKQIRALRTQGKEKEWLHPSIYKWSYGLLTKR